VSSAAAIAAAAIAARWSPSSSSSSAWSATVLGLLDGGDRGGADRGALSDYSDEACRFFGV
jgi:hypothetical protein